MASSGSVIELHNTEVKLRKTMTQPQINVPPKSIAPDGACILPAPSAKEGANPQQGLVAVASLPGIADVEDASKGLKRIPSRSARRKATKRMLRRTGVLPYTGVRWEGPNWGKHLCMPLLFCMHALAFLAHQIIFQCPPAQPCVSYCLSGVRI